MNPLFRQRTIKQIVSSRKTERRKKTGQFRPLAFQQPEVVTQQKVQYLSRKNNLNNQDKLILLRYIEKKYRLRFQSIFAANLTTWVCQREKKVIDKNYDSSKRSYYLLKGKLSVCQRGGGIRETKVRDQKQKYEEIAILQGETAIGKIFDQAENYQRCVLIAQNATLLRIDHDQDQLTFIQRNCLLTNEQRQTTVKKFSLFQHLDNVNKYHTPCFKTKIFFKGEIIYNIGDPAEHLFMIVEGEIQFQTKIPIQNPQTQRNPSLAQLTLKNSFQRFLSIGTQTITAGNFFGQEELLSQTPRKQTAYCLSLQALLILVPSDRFQKLLYHNQFKDTLLAAANDRQIQRKTTIASMVNLQSPKKQLTSRQKSQKSSIIQFDFNQFNEKVYKVVDKITNASPKISLLDKRIRLLHGNPIKVPPKCKIKSINFSMLQVNKDQYLKSLKKFKLFDKQQKKKQLNLTKNSNQTDKDKSPNYARSLQRIWRVLKLQNVLEDENEKMVFENKEGKTFYHAHMRLTKHIVDNKSYRPKTISSGKRVKTQYVQYLQSVI